MIHLFKNVKHAAIYAFNANRKLYAKNVSRVKFYNKN